MPDMPHNTRAVGNMTEGCGRIPGPDEQPTRSSAPPHDAGAGETEELPTWVLDEIDKSMEAMARVPSFSSLPVNQQAFIRVILAHRAAVSDRDEASAYTITLQRIIEAVCSNAALPSDAAEKAPHHAAMVSEYRARSERAREELQTRLDTCFIAGNSLATVVIARKLDSVPWDASIEHGRNAFRGEDYELWLAWRTIMAVSVAPSTPGEEKAG